MHLELTTRYRAEAAATRLKAEGFEANVPPPRLSGEHIVRVSVATGEEERVLAIVRQVDPSARLIT